MDEISDLSRLASLAQLASPSHRRSTPKHDSNNIVPTNQPIVRCICQTLTPNGEMIQCCVCGCMSHLQCIVDEVIENENEWVCPFCRSNDIDTLRSNGIDLQTMHHAIRNSKATGHYEEVVKSAQKISRVTEELKKAASWIGTLCSRYDIYESIAETADACIDGDFNEEIKKELDDERALMDDLSKLLYKMADESENLPIPILSCVADQVKTHPL